MSRSPPWTHSHENNFRTSFSGSGGRTGKTVVSSTHGIEEAVYLGQQVAGAQLSAWPAESRLWTSTW